MQKHFRPGATFYAFDTDLAGNARGTARIADEMELVWFASETHGSDFPGGDECA